MPEASTKKQGLRTGCCVALDDNCVKFRVGFLIDIALHATDREKVSDLRTDAGDPRLETADMVAGAAVARQLIVNVADQTNLNLLGHKLRRAPIEVHVDAILILGRRIIKL